MTAAVSGFLLSLLSLLSVAGSQRLVRRNAVLEVPNGRVAYLRQDLLSFHVHPGQICKVEVITTEPMHQRVGKLRPEVFDCDFLPKSMRYEHNGSPLLEEDSVKMRAFILLENRTLEETFTLKIRIVNSRCDVIQVSGKELAVPENDRYSNSIDANIVQFHYDRVRFMHRCRIRVYRDRERGFPIAGRIVRVTADGESQVVEIDDHSEEFDCDEFLLRNVKYEHDSDSRSPNMDYVPIHIIVSDSRSGYAVTEERHWFPISLIGKSQNFPPYIDSSVRRNFEVDEFILTNILPNSVSVRDVETVQKKMIYNITDSPREGFITHLSDETQPIESFLQQDVATMRIGYQPPNISYPERRTYDVEMTALDAFFQPSRPFRIGVSVRNTDTNAPRILWNMGLTLLEGQCRPINKEVLKIMDRDNLNQVRVTLAGGPQHGNLLVNGRPGYTFTWTDLGQGSVSYCHDDSDTRSDSITFRLTDIYHSTRFKLPIRVLPKDDAPPFLISNIVLRGNEGENILINRSLLEASDLDSDPAFITFNITRPPVAGEVQKKRDWEKVGWRVNSFVQSDLFQGLISYKHLGREIFEDFFEIILIDSNRPLPNISPVLRVDIKITPIDDLPPQPGPGNSLSLTVRETDLFILTPGQLHHFDVEHPREDLQYEIIGGCHREEGGSIDVDAGRIISLEHVPMPMKDPSLASISTFTQKAINHSKIAYMPPVADIGLYPQQIRFYFTVTSSSGIKLGPKQFTIEVLPVDNEIPSINLLPLTIREGEATDISSDSVFIHDPDTALSDLIVMVSEPPQFGELLLDGRILSTGDSFSDDDLDQARLRYKHDGSESMNDQLMFTVSDGRHNSSAFMTIMVEGVDDEMPKIVEGNARLILEEKGSVLITPENLSATDVDTTDNFLVFDVLEYPKQGNIQIGANPTLRFTQQDIIEGEVRYVHNEEIGTNEAFDSFTVMVSDRHLPDSAATSDEMEAAIKTIEIAISPIDDQPPKVLIGEQVLKCNEAERTLLTVEYLNAEDVDTEVSQLTFHISSPPTFGYIEDRTPRPGYEKIIGKKSDSFTYQQLLLNYISYVQSNHSGIEPVSDSFLFYVSDGVHDSIEVPFLISILPQNDEPPNLICSNLTCMEGSMAPLVLEIEDLDVPHDHVMVLVTKRPSHGMIMNEVEHIKRKRSSNSRRSIDDHMESVEEFSMHDLHSRQIVPAYLHDGSENFNDDFELKITDGKHEKKRNLNIRVVGVNDQRPELLTNVELKVNPGEAAIITNRYLHAYDRDTYPGNINYIINVLPRRGTLLRQESDGQWRSLDVASHFTEYDVVLNRVKYQHETGLGIKSQDSFSFHVTDGILSTRKKTFSISIRYEHQLPLYVQTNRFSVEQNQKQRITTDILTVKYGGTRDPGRISYQVVIQPRYGNIEYLQFPGVSIDHFTQLDLIGAKVAYVHNSKEDDGEDSFRVTASNGLRTKSATIYIEITKVDRELPVLVINNSTRSTYDERKTVVVYRGTTRIINSIISITDADTADEHLYLQITQLPVNGKLLIGERNATRWDNVTKTELIGRRLSYQHNRNDRHLLDYFDFTVHDGTNDGYVFLGTPRIGQSTRLFISIEELDEEAPQILVNKQPYDIKPIHEKRKNSKLYLSIDRNHLRSEDKGTKSPENLKFVITRKPLYGIIKKLVNGVWRSCERFTQDHLNHGWVRYVISRKLRVTNDSFVFSIGDYWGNKLHDQRFQLSWSRLAMNITKSLKVCEGGKLSIGFVRKGNLNVSSFISASIISKTMKAEVDYASNCTQLLQFDPGVSEKTWHLWTLDNHLEGRVKKMKIHFRNPVNSLFLRKKPVKIAMLDASHRRCSKRERKSKKKSKKGHKIANDRPITAILRKHAKVTGTRIYPQSYFSNGTDRVWTINAISTITINDGESDPPPPSQRKVPQDEAFMAEPASFLADDNHKPIETKSQVNNASLVHVPKRCTLSNQGEVFYYSESHLLLECNGAEWLAWRPKTKQQNQTTASIVCDTGWKVLDHRCIYVSDGRSDYDRSWNTASRACRELHSASLVAVRNKRELSQLWKMTKKSSFWFGLNRKLNPAKWEWSNDNELTYLNWKQNFPKKRDECAYVGPRKLWRSSACDIRHKQKIKYVCSKSG